MTLMVKERNWREAEHNTDQGVQQPAEAKPPTQPPRTRTQREGGGAIGQIKGKEFPAGGKTWTASPPEWVKEGGGGEASRVAGNPVGDRQGVGRGFESLRGTDTPRSGKVSLGGRNLRSDP